jgi:hypothetical protein
MPVRLLGHRVRARTWCDKCVYPSPCHGTLTSWYCIVLSSVCTAAGFRRRHRERRLCGPPPSRAGVAVAILGRSNVAAQHLDCAHWTCGLRWHLCRTLRLPPHDGSRGAARTRASSCGRSPGRAAASTSTYFAPPPPPVSLVSSSLAQPQRLPLALCVSSCRQAAVPSTTRPLCLASVQSSRSTACCAAPARFYTRPSPAPSAFRSVAAARVSWTARLSCLVPGAFALRA